MFTKRLVEIFVMVGLMIIIAFGATLAEAPAGEAVTTIRVEFLNPLVNERSFYIGEVWNYPTYNGSEVGKKLVVEGRARGLNGPGTPANISPTWVPSDPHMVQVSPSQGHRVKITVSKPGKSSLMVTLGGISRKIAIKARYSEKIMHVEFSQ